MPTTASAPQRRHRRPRLLAALTITALTAAALAGCSSSGEDTPLIGISMPTTAQARWVADGKNLDLQFSALGYDVDMAYAEDDPDKQSDQIQDMVDAGVDVLVVGAVDGTKLKSVLAKAAAADVPVISYDRLIRDSGDVAYYATFDNWRVGVMEGTALLRGLGLIDAAGQPVKGKGPFNIEVFAGSPDDNNATFFYDGAMSVVRPFIDSGAITVPSGQIERTDVAIAGWKNDVAGARMDSLLEPYKAGKHLDGVLAPNDGIAQAILTSVKKGLGYVPVVPGQDAEVPAVKSIAAGEQFATVYKDTRVLAEVTVLMTRNLLEGTPPEVNDTTTYDNGVKVVPAFLLSPQLVNKDNYEHVLVEGGYYTKAELS